MRNDVLLDLASEKWLQEKYQGEDTNGLMGQIDRRTTYEEGYKGIPREEINGLMGQTDRRTTYEDGDKGIPRGETNRLMEQTDRRKTYEGYKGNTKGRNKWTDGTD